jgi:hypothetical protein
MSTNHAKPLGLPGRVGTTVLAATSLCLALVGTQANTVDAATPSIQTLNPEPPPSYTCTAIGVGVRCSSDTVVVLDPEPIGITCGSGAGAFEVMDQATRRVKAVRWYDRDGNLVKRVRDNLFSDTRLSNPVTGASVPYDQHDIDTDILAIPGDLGSATTYSEEHIVASVPGYGTVLVSVGRSVRAPDGTLLSRTGRRDFDAYFGGDRSVLDELCAALGAQ